MSCVVFLCVKFYRFSVSVMLSVNNHLHLLIILSGIHPKHIGPIRTIAHIHCGFVQSCFRISH